MSNKHTHVYLYIQMHVCIGTYVYVRNMCTYEYIRNVYDVYVHVSNIKPKIPGTLHFKVRLPFPSGLI